MASQPPTANHAKHLGFTLIELLVVISIIALLIAILLPALSAARQQAKMAQELTASKQLGMAYLGFAYENKGKLLPGYAKDSAKAENGFGVPINYPGNKRYPWRLAAYLDHEVAGSLFVEDQLWFAEAHADGMDDKMFAYQASIYPSFGLNYHFLGGSEDAKSNPNIIDQSVGLVDEIRSASKQLVFASARSNSTYLANLGHNRHQKGHHELVSPNKAWTVAGSKRTWSEETFDPDPFADPTDWGNLDLRWQKQAVVNFADGHSALTGEDDLRDMTIWATAQTSDPDWVPMDERP